MPRPGATNTAPPAEPSWCRNVFDFNKLQGASVASDPFDFFVVEDFVDHDATESIIRDYPDVNAPKNFRLEQLELGGSFQAFVEQLQSPEFAEAVGNKFHMDLVGKPVEITVRGLCERTDGKIHTDSKTKLVTALLYFNEEWSQPGGQLRMLRSEKDIEDYAAEVAPLAGTMLAFRRSDRSFHGHKAFEGQRRMVQISWVKAKRKDKYKDKRKKLGWRIKRFLKLD